MTAIIIALAIVRLTRLITVDKITDPLRKRILDKAGATHWITYLMYCPWCLSIHIALIAWWLLIGFNLIANPLATHPAISVIVLTLATSWLTGISHRAEQ